jgi:hypothetical protein
MAMVDKEMVGRMVKMVVDRRQVEVEEANIECLQRLCLTTRLMMIFREVSIRTDVHLKMAIGNLIPN